MPQENVIIDPLVRDLMERAAIGEAAKQFLRSGLGKHLTERATQEVDEALAELVEVSPTRNDQIGELQNQIKVASKAITWLAEAISEGDNAMNQLSEES